MELNFTKMEGIGNNFVLVDSRTEKLDGINLIELSKRICDRNFGVGADGLIIVWPSTKANYRMQIFNPDGSEPEMCGNGIRCFAKYVFEKDQLKTDVISVETKAGIMVPAMVEENGVVSAVEVDMGIPKDEGKVSLMGFDFRKISIGNPHAVSFSDDLSNLDLAEIGPMIELDSHFPNRTNVEFVDIINDHEIRVMVWERGAGATLACGTGACASVAAAVLGGKTGKKVLVHLPGGELEIEWQDDGHILMRGPAENVFKGAISI
ncbi:MAG: diaminopimelate epimerase [Candidatus Margulisiibacteriota bacterium]